MSQPSIPKGMRDFSPQQMVRRKFIFETIEQVFRKFGFQPLETPAMETLKTLTGKYGEEGDRLIFKVLNSGDFLKKVDPEALQEKRSSAIAPRIAEKALRYDLTVPFARYVVQHQHEVTFPFKRYQIQPVWRADRPQKGRYREFYQCDADVVGTDSLLCEVELVQLFDEALSALQVPQAIIRINNRKVLSGLAEVAGQEDKLTTITVAIDKLDKIGKEKVIEEMKEHGVTGEAIEKIDPLFEVGGESEERLTKLEELLRGSEKAQKGLEELRYVMERVEETGLKGTRLDFQPTLARGLDYYTGAIFEVTTDATTIGSICGGGRYDDLTGVFGMKGVSGVGISFGADRIYDVLDELALFPAELAALTEVLFVHFGEEPVKASFPLLQKVREQGVRAEIYPDQAKLKKQMKYADQKGIPYVVMIGEEELTEGKAEVRNMRTGDQEKLPFDDLPARLAVLSRSREKQPSA